MVAVWVYFDHFEWEKKGDMGGSKETGKEIHLGSNAIRSGGVSLEVQMFEKT